MKPGDPIGIVGVLLLLSMLAVWIAAELFPDFQIIPSRKKRPPGEIVVDAMFILYTLFLAGFGLCVPLGLLVKLGMPVEVLTLPALMGAWAMLQLMPHSGLYQDGFRCYYDTMFEHS